MENDIKTKKELKSYRIYFNKLKATKNYPNKKIVYKYFKAFSLEDALSLAEIHASFHQLKVIK